MREDMTMRKALIDGQGRVQNVILLDMEMWDAPTGLTVEDCDDLVGPGWRRAGGGWEPGVFEEDAV